MKILKKIFAAIGGCLAAVLLTAAVVIFFYFPRYITQRRPFDITEKDPSTQITLMSVNVRCFSPTDLFRKSWFYRAPLVLENVRAAEPDVIGFQEVTRMHNAYLSKTLAGYDSVLTYRDKSLLSEGCPIFYSTAKFTLIDKGSFWLSETPDVMSRGWDAAFNRVCSYVILERKSDGKQLAVFNTHLDHISDTARINGMQVILDKIRQFGNLPSVIMGDLNATEQSATYAAATAQFFDAKYQTDDTDTGATYQNWGESLDGENIDYFMLSKTGVTADTYRVIRTTYDGVYPSDHFPILLKIELD